MGWLTSPGGGAATGARRGLLRRPVLLFGLLLLGPAVGFSLLGWRSVAGEAVVRRRDAEREAESILRAEVERAAASLETLRRAEEERPYFEYQQEFVPARLLADNLGLAETPLKVRSPDPRVLGWFQWERGSRGIPEAAETFGPGGEAWGAALAATYGPHLRERLGRVEGDVDLRAGRQVDYALWVVKGNEERGQLFEELQIVQGQRRGGAAAQRGDGDLSRQQEGTDRASPPAAPAPQTAPAPQSAPALSPYLANFFQVAGDDPVPVRYSPFRFLARGTGQAGPPLVLWRLVWIPGVHAEKRTGARDRWLLQGVALDPGAGEPAGFASVGPALLARAELAAPVEGPAARLSLVDALDAALLPGASLPDPSLVWTAVADPATWRAEGEAALRRFLLLVAALLLVVGVGFVVLLRGVRRELALARTKEDFVAAVTHELKTPLTGIRMYAEMLKEGWASDEEAARRQAQRILDESARLGALVEQVLDLAALERGVLKANLVPGDLGASVRAAAESLVPKAREAGVTLLVDVPAGLDAVPHDERLVRPLVLNLVDNAIKHGGRGAAKEVRVTLGAQGDGVVLTVADRGPGLPPEVIAHLFDPFRRGEGEMTRTTTGVGIGLALVKRYADALGAAVAVGSPPQGGTVFTVRFPLP